MKTKHNNFVYVIQVRFFSDEYENSGLLAESYTSRLSACKRMLGEAEQLLQDNPDYEAVFTLDHFHDEIKIIHKDNQDKPLYKLEVLELELCSSIEESKGE